MPSPDQSVDARFAPPGDGTLPGRPPVLAATSPAANDFVEVLRARALATPARVAFTLLGDGERVSSTSTYAALDGEARAVGATLQAHGAAGERVLLLVSHHASFLRAFLGCLYAGAAAVPTAAGRSRERLRLLAGDAQPRVVLTTRRDRERWPGAGADIPELASAVWIDVDDIVLETAVAWRPPSIDRDTLALLQYTSGSTGAPKGVMVTHGNLMHNARAMCGIVPLHEASVAVSWLPVFHDMGLMGGILQPVYTGATCVLMPSAAFAQRPARWLEAISRHGGTATAAPNFAFDFCVDRVTPAERAPLDLSSLEIAACAAEPVSARTLDRFARAFAACGFRREAFSPAYGIAEATLVVTGTLPLAPPLVISVDPERLLRGTAVRATDEAQGRELVASGAPLPGMEVRIVDPASREEKRDGEVGEIWVCGGSVAAGYWRRPAASEETLAAQVVGDGARRFLRTGDLGFLADGMLFVVGRHTDMIIVRGRNHAPQDIERTAERAHASLAANASAAFLVEIEGADRLVLVAETRVRKDDADLAVVAAAVSAAIAEEHGLELHALTLLLPNALPRTTSGKVRRGEARSAWAADALRGTVRRWTRASAHDVPLAPQPRPDGSRPPSSTQIETWLVEQVARLLGADPSEVDPLAPATALGLDSQKAVAISGALAEWLGRPLSATLLFDGGCTLRDVALELADDGAATATTDGPRGGDAALTAEETRRLLLQLDRLSPVEIEALLRSTSSALGGGG